MALSKSLSNKLTNYNRVQRARSARGAHAFKQISTAEFKHMLNTYGESDTIRLLQARSGRTANIEIDFNNGSRGYLGDYQSAQIISEFAEKNQHILIDLDEIDRAKLGDPAALAMDRDLLDLVSDRIDIAESQEEIIAAYERALKDTFSEYSGAWQTWKSLNKEQQYNVATSNICDISYVYEDSDEGERNDELVFSIVQVAML